MDKIFSIIIRYAAIIALSLSSLYVFYLIFTPLTLYLSYFILGLFYNASIEHSAIAINGSLINLIDACIAGAAYFLLLMLNLSTPNVKKRLVAFAADCAAFLALNVLRIVVLSVLFLSEFAYFSEAHVISWHLLSAFFVIIIWIATTKILKTRGIPFYSDIIYLKNIITRKK